MKVNQVNLPDTSSVRVKELVHTVVLEQTFRHGKYLSVDYVLENLNCYNYFIYLSYIQDLQTSITLTYLGYMHIIHIDILDITHFLPNKSTNYHKNITKPSHHCFRRYHSKTRFPEISAFFFFRKFPRSKRF